MPKTKIVATIGPSSWDDTVIRRMFDSGVAVARVNSSFADKSELKRVSEQVRRLSDRVALMIDTRGHQIRFSEVENEIDLRRGERFSFFTEIVSNGVYIEAEGVDQLEKLIPLHAMILVDDGLIKLRVVEKRKGEIICDVIQGGILKGRKAVAIPDVKIEPKGMLDEDKEEILYAKRLGFDLIAASFIRSVHDIRAVRDLVGNYDMGIIAKIEDEAGVDNFDEILKEADGIMIARGDLGIGIPSEKVPILQKRFISKCNEIGKPVIVATQMLYSMTDMLLPTRPEVNDVANAVYDGADALMLSAETAVGKYPVESVEMMARISREVEDEIGPEDRGVSTIARPTTNAIAKSVMETCATLPIDKIVVATGSGVTAQTIARFRPRQPIYAFTDSKRVRRRLALSWGVVADIINASQSSSRDSGVQLLVKCAKTKGYVSNSDMIVVVAGANIMGQGGTNMLEVNRVEHIIS